MPIVHARANSAYCSILGLNQYTLRSKTYTYYYPSTLRSPNIYEHSACFTFQYYETSIGYYGYSRLSVSIRITNNHQLLPLWIKNIREERGKWRKIKILLAHQSGFNQVNRLFVNILSKSIRLGSNVFQNESRLAFSHAKLYKFYQYRAIILGAWNELENCKIPQVVHASWSLC